jgi:predicted MFS family arabinose efflux permease
LWIATVASNIGTWFQSVGAAWLMTTLTPSETMVALVQAATSLPMFALALPSGVLADLLDRRQVLLATQIWMAAVAATLAALTLAGAVTPWRLLLFTALLGMGAALMGPAWQASIPELVPRGELAAAIALGSIGFNIARAAGPALGGLLVAAAGPAATFALNAVSFLGVLTVLRRWRRSPEESSLPAEPFWGALMTGVRYVRHAPEVLAVIARGSLFLFCASALWALLPVVASQKLRAGPAGYGLLLTALGLGAVAGAMALPRLRRRWPLDRIVAAAVLVFAAAMGVLAWVPQLPLVGLAMLVGGGAWLSLLSSLNVTIQTAVPSWVRARALSVYMLFFFGALTLGSTLWGAVAGRLGVAPALSAAAVGVVFGLTATYRIRLRSGEGLDLAPSRQWPAPIVHHEPEPDRGPVLVTVEYRIDPADKRPFAAALRDLRRVRLRDGAMQWGLFNDAAVEGRYVEMFLVKSWVEHLRQHERITFADRELEERVHAFHLGPERPRVEHLIAERVPRQRG